MPLPRVHWVGFATKPVLATAMIEPALDAGVPARWVIADEIYGADPQLIRCLETRGIDYVLAIARAAGHSRVPVDGTLIRTDRCHAPGPTV